MFLLISDYLTTFLIDRLTEIVKSKLYVSYKRKLWLLLDKNVRFVRAFDCDYFKCFYYLQILLVLIASHSLIVGNHNYFRMYCGA